jgi:hypothetical protein
MTHHTTDPTQRARHIADRETGHELDHWLWVAIYAQVLWELQWNPFAEGVE